MAKVLKVRLLFFLSSGFLMLTWLGCGGRVQPESKVKPVSQLEQFVEQYTQESIRVDPFSAPYYDLTEGLDQFGDYPSPAYFTRYEKLIQSTWNRLESEIDRSKLSARDELLYDLFKGDLEIKKEGIKMPDRYLAMNQMGNRIRHYLNFSSPAMSVFPFRTRDHFEAWLKRSTGFPAFVEAQMTLMREGHRLGYKLNCTIVEKTRNSYKEALVTDISQSPFLRPLELLPKDMTAEDKESYRKRFLVAADKNLHQPLRSFDQFMKTEVKKNCRKSYGIGALPNGKTWYQHRIWSSTGLRSLTAEQIHQTGLSEVARIKADIERIMAKRGFKGTLSQFLRERRADPNNYFKSGEEVVQTFEKTRSRIDPVLSRLFVEIPSTPYKVVEAENPEEAAASYWKPIESKPFGRFVVNTKNLKSNQRSGVTTLSLHEANPGHHFHYALLFEKRGELSTYQSKVFHSIAFTEGWALYAERLGREIGLFDDENQLLGHLNDEMMRAVRLVVDTGIHAKGWSRERTIGYMMDHMASDRSGIEIEADRYSVWPGQALGYKIGQLKILELRSKAQRELGQRFDIREFHRQVLGTGSLSLPVLEAKIEKWIVKNKI